MQRPELPRRSTPTIADRSRQKPGEDDGSLVIGKADQLGAAVGSHRPCAAPSHALPICRQAMRRDAGGENEQIRSLVDDAEIAAAARVERNRATAARI
jgi:hypothetical protein